MTDSPQVENVNNRENGYPKGFRFLFVLVAITWLFLGIQVAVNNLGSSNTSHLSSQNDDNRMLLRAYHFKIKALEKKVDSMSRELDYITKNYLPNYKPDTTSGNNGISLNDEEKNLNDEVNSSEKSNDVSSAPTKPEDKAKFENMAFENNTSASDVSEIKERTEALDKKISEMSQEAGKVSSLQNSNNLIIASAKLKDAVKSSRGFSSELDNISSLVHEDEELAPYLNILKKSSQSGILPTEGLMDKFNEVADKILIEEKKQKENPTLSDKVKLSFAKIVKVRKIKTEGSSTNTEDILARAYSYLLSSNLAKALDEMKTLDESLKPVANEWIEKAEANINSVDASEKIFEYVTKPSYTNKVF